MAPGTRPEAVFTIGHATHGLERFLDLLSSHGVEQVVDVRSIPRSRHNPQFNREALPAALEARGIRYVHLAALGGLRHARPDSPNAGWRNASFRGYADHMLTPGFEAGLDDLLRLAGEKRTAVMCAEAVPWRCHRSLIADALLARGVAVEHIMKAGALRAHALTPWAHVEGGRVTYPAEAAPPGEDREEF